MTATTFAPSRAETPAYTSAPETIHLGSDGNQSLMDSSPDLSCADCDTHPDFDLRTAPRVVAHEPLQVWIPDLFDVSLFSNSVDYSPGGLRLHSPLPLDRGTVLYVRPADVCEEGSWIPVEVRHCRPDERGWTLGCQFTNADGTV
jgi:hypothetical protein